MVKYNKLIRDSIPDVVFKPKGINFKMRIAKPEEFGRLLRAKLEEEVNEFFRDDNLGELADILEVVYALAEHKGSSREALEHLREQFAREKGAFEKGIILEEADARTE